MHVTILGGSGFVGSALVRHLTEQCKAQVTTLRRPLFDLTKPQSFEVIPESTDVLIHAAGAIGGNLKDQLYWDVNVTSTYNLVRFLNKRPRKPRFIYLSTGAVKGGRKDFHQSSDDYEFSGEIYPTTKLLSENIIELLYEGSVFIPRLYFPYGSLQDGERLIPRLISQIRRSSPITLSKGGGPLLSIVHIHDLVKYLGAVTGIDITGKVEVAGNTTVRLSQIIASIEEHTGDVAIINEIESPSLNYFSNNVLQFSQKTLDEGIAETCGGTA